MRTSTCNGFTLIELSAVLGIVTLVMAQLVPAAGQARQEARARGSASNLAQIGQGSGMYALDNAGLLHTYTWRPNIFYPMPDGKIRMGGNWVQAAAWQNTEILMRRTGRIHGQFKFKSYGSRQVHRRYTHLVLMDYMDRPFPDALFADPSDTNLLKWQENPTDISVAAGIPYEGYVPSGYDDPGGWTEPGPQQRWAFGSSYQRTVFAWNPDGWGETTYSPVHDTPHLFVATQGAVDLSGRYFSEIRFPSGKVEYFEEFDRAQAGSPYFAYDHARPDKLMFDGSVNDWASGEAGPSASPAEGKVEWRQRYVPLHTFPIPLGGLGDHTELSQRYRWTFNGLAGVDYPRPIMGR